jgi:O-antigen ligase
VTSSVLAPPGSESRLTQPSSDSRLNQVCLYGVVALVLFGPLAFGAVESWSISIMEVGAALLFMLWGMRQVASGELEIRRNPLFGPMLLFGALILWQLVTGRTVYHAATFSAALLYCAYGLVSFLTVQCLRRTSQLRNLAWIFSVYGFAIATFALLQGIAGNGKLYWLRVPQSDGWIYGPYVNHNHYAGLMEMLIPIPLVISLIGGVCGRSRALALLAAAVMASTIFLSGSRGGMAAFAVQIILLAAFLLKQRRNWTAPFALAGFLALSLILLLWLGGGDLADRLTSLHTEARAGLSSATRLTVDRDALKIFAHRPLMGWGLGVFGVIYPSFSSLSTSSKVGMAHNDYLQLLVEMGAAGFVVALWFLVALFRSARRKLNHATSATNAAVTLAALLGISGILVHSLVDFNLQIPANATLFYVVCAVAAMEPSFSRHRRPHVVRAARKSPRTSPAHDFEVI